MGEEGEEEKEGENYRNDRLMICPAAACFLSLSPHLSADKQRVSTQRHSVATVTHGGKGTP